MQTVKKYGRSLVQFPNSAQPSRTIILKPEREKPEREKTEREINSEIAVLADNPEFIIANWISVIDKIFTKPNGQDKATEKQRTLRDNLGKECWKIIKTHAAFKGLDKDGENKFSQFFVYKLHPYHKDNENDLDKIKKVKLYGRMCSLFTGHSLESRNSGAEIKFDTAQIAGKIEHHLYAKILRKSQSSLETAPASPSSKATTGLIGNKISSVAKNFHAYDKKLRFSAEDAAFSAYFNNNRTDVAAQIYLKLHAETQAKKPNISYANIVAQIIQDHSKAIFNADRISEAKIENPALYQLQETVKAYYKSLFDLKIGKDKKDINGKTPDKKAKILERAPKNNHELRRMIENIAGNRDLASKLRLGKAVYYQLLDRDTAKSAPDWTNLPTQPEIAASHYWQTAGQTAIKRNESLVRVWRQVTVYANHSLNQWGDPDNNISGDIFGANEINATVNKWQIHDERLHQGLLLILGHQHDTIFSNNLDKKFAQQKNLLEWSLKSWSQLRHKGFHFNGRNKFIQMLQGVELPVHADAKDVLTKLWDSDQTAQQTRLKDILFTSHCEEYLDQDQLQRIYDELALAQPNELPMPRFNRILTRVENKKAWHKFNLPKPAKERSLEKYPALLCQYTLLKLLYQKGFSQYLTKISPRDLQYWINRAVEIADKEAKNLNKKKTNEVFQKFIQSKSSDFSANSVDATATINEFLFELSRQTAVEFQVQKNVYHSDGKKAKEQAEYLENIKCDVLLQAFAEYVNSPRGNDPENPEGQFAFLLNLNHDSPEIPIPSLVNELKTSTAQIHISDWQKALYFMLHFVPAGFVSTLFHQLKKWHILADKGDLATHQDRDKSGQESKLFNELAVVMMQYLDMHDANSEGTPTPTGSKKLIDLFEDKRAFHRVFPNVIANPNASQQAGEKPITLPRGMREFLRFGHQQKVFDVLKAKVKISHDSIDRLHQLEKEIDNAHARLEKNHNLWKESRDKRQFCQENPEKLREYKSDLALQSEYRQLKNRISLNNHLRAHQLLMQILARLVDYANLWERDQIFLLLALAHQHGYKSMELVLDVEGCAKFADGQAVEARRNLRK